MSKSPGWTALRFWILAWTSLSQIGSSTDVWFQFQSYKESKPTSKPDFSFKIYCSKTTYYFSTKQCPFVTKDKRKRHNYTPNVLGFPCTIKSISLQIILTHLSNAFFISLHLISSINSNSYQNLQRLRRHPLPSLAETSSTP